MKAGRSSAGSDPPVLPFVVVAALLVLGVAVVVARRARSRSEAPDELV